MFSQLANSGPLSQVMVLTREGGTERACSPGHSPWSLPSGSGFSRRCNNEFFSPPGRRSRPYFSPAAHHRVRFPVSCLLAAIYTLIPLADGFCAVVFPSLFHLSVALPLAPQLPRYRACVPADEWSISLSKLENCGRRISLLSNHSEWYSGERTASLTHDSVKNAEGNS